MKYLLYCLGTIWSLPAILICYMFYIMPFWLFRHIRFDKFADFLVPMFIVRTDRFNWYTAAWRDWGGWSGPNVMILKIDPDDDPRYRRTITHELQHCRQQMALGIFFYPAYLLNSIGLWLFRRDLHAYYDNWFERNARQAAGQQIDIPSSQWGKGPQDRWPWW